MDNSKDCKLAIRYYFFIKKVFAFWLSKKQYIILISIIKAKYIAFGYALREKVWICYFLNKMAFIKDYKIVTKRTVIKKLESQLIKKS